MKKCKHVLKYLMSSMNIRMDAGIMRCRVQKAGCDVSYSRLSFFFSFFFFFFIEFQSHIPTMLDLPVVVSFYITNLQT